EAYRLGLGDVDVAARCGVHKETIRAWMRDGTNISTDLLAGRRTWDSLTRHERKVVDFVQQAAVAETEGKMLLVGLAEKLARGGITQRTITRKVDGDGNLIEETTRTESTLPDAGMIRWILSHRWRDEWGDKVTAEVTGP